MINYHVYLKNVSKTFLHKDNYPTATNHQNLFFFQTSHQKYLECSIIWNMFTNIEEIFSNITAFWKLLVIYIISSIFLQFDYDCEFDNHQKLHMHHRNPIASLVFMNIHYLQLWDGKIIYFLDIWKCIQAIKTDDCW